MNAHRVLFLAASAALAAAPAAAQLPVTPRALGMGGAYLGVARGQEALFLNPANIALPNSPHWSAGIPTLSAGATVRGIGIGDAIDIADYGDLSEERQAEILGDIPASGTGAEADVRVPLAALQIRNFAVGVSYNLTGSHTVDRDIVDLLFNGVQARPYTIGDTEGFRAAYWDVAAAYARRVGPVALGVTGHWFSGQEVVRSGVVSVQTVTLPVPDVRVTYAGVRSEGGSGFGLDVGAAFQPTPAITLSAAVANAVNTFEWDDERLQRAVVINRDDYENGDLEAINDRYVESETAYDEAAASDAVRALAADLDEGVDLPSQLRLGAAFRASPWTTVAASYQGNLEDSRITGLWNEQAAVGVQQGLPFLPIVSVRAGLASNLEDGSLLSGGLSVGPINFGVARIDSGDERAGWIATFGLTARSNSVMP